MPIGCWFSLFFVGYALLNAVITVELNKRCLGCRQRTVKRFLGSRRAYPHHSPAYYRCENCGVHYIGYWDGRWKTADADDYDRLNALYLSV